MTLIGYTMMCEQAGPKQLVRDVALAEQAGFDFAVISDHYFPWLDSQGHSPYAWSVLGAAAQATERIPLMTYVTCPIRRYHPAVVAQKAATMQLLSDGRFTLGLGAGENLNEHIVGGGWPIAGVRHEMLEEAVEIIRALWAGDTVTYRGKHFDVESAKVWDLPESPPPIGIAVSGPGSCRLAGRHADVMIAVEPRSELGEMFDDAGGVGKPRVGQIALSYDPDRADRGQAGDGSVPLVHRQLESQRRAPGSRVVQRRVQDGARRRRVDARCRAVPTYSDTSPGYASSRAPASPTSRWYKSAGTPKNNSSAGRQPNCCPRSELVDETRRLSRAFRHGGHGRTRGMGSAAAGAISSAVDRAVRVQRRYLDAVSGCRVGDGRPQGIADGDRPRADGDYLARRLLRRHRRCLGGSRRPPTCAPRHPGDHVGCGRGARVARRCRGR